ncbi:Ribonucleotide reductase, stirrup [Moorella glycerini]|uniref:YcfA-like protein n=1 Tax=Neomoorella stamsii TaxID=1266720 RepID=A0A9X7J4J5_9FIRM|nr:YcfA-like protein [Moorella stamsii]CEP67113.1 Ribonucleotide reductase, stirrup [Moorella glycerini]
MKRKELLRHLHQYGCRQLREGGNHTVFFNPSTFKTSTVPRHNEIEDFLANKICKDLGIPLIKKPS